MKTCIIRSGLAIAFAALLSATASAAGGHVLAPNEKPYGYSLKDMAKELAYFNSSLNDPCLYPQTPFQILYLSDPDASWGSFKGVKAGTVFFVPIFWANDSEPVVGKFPKNEAKAEKYIFDPKQFGGQFEIEVDGKVTCVGPEYLAGPISAPGLAGGGSHFIQLGVFLAPLSKGRHVVQIRGCLDGKELVEANDGPYVFDVTYQVVVR